MSGYQRINFKDQNVERPKTYDVTNNPDGSITLIESFGNVEELGTPINQENMNHIEDGIDAVSFSKFSLDLTYKKDDLVTDIQEEELKIFKSLKDNNFGHLLGESEYWEEVNISDGGLAAQLELKANVDLTNVTDQGKILMSSMGMPSSKYIDLTLGASGTTYTAPANGWVFLDKGGLAGEIAFIVNVTKKYAIGGVQFVRISCPVQKNDTFRVDYGLTGTTSGFRFFYAEGEAE